MKNILIRCLLIACVACAGSSVYADDLVKGDESDLKKLLNATTKPQSAIWVSYIGQARGRLYFLYESSIHASSLFTDEMSHVVYWFPETSLTEEQLEVFKEQKAARNDSKKESKS